MESKARGLLMIRGVLTLGAVIASKRVQAPFWDGPTAQPFRHGYTYGGHPASCAAGLANLEIIEREGLVERAAVVGARMLERLKPTEELEAVAEVRGVGLMLGVELAGERDAAPVAAGALERGVVVRASGQKIRRS